MDGYTELDIGQIAEREVVEFIDGILDGECGFRVGKRLPRSVHKYFADFHPDGRLFVALSRDNAIRAVLAVDRLTKAKALLKWIFVAPEDRRRGLGSRLVDRAVEFARASGYSKLVVGTLPRMKGALHLYEKKGFSFRQQVTFWRSPMLVYERDLQQEGADAEQPSSGVLQAAGDS
jgi:GNAT superfamily N-acetyltransferase